MRDSLLDSAPNPRLLSAQQHVLEILVDLLRIDHRIYEISEVLPLPAIYISMEEGLMPYSGFGHLYVTLQRVKGQYLKPAIETLLKGGQMSNDDAIARGAQ